MINIQKTAIDKANSYTSIGTKYVYHPEQIGNFLKGNGHSVISAILAPTNKCNLSCTYCNQANRDRNKILPLDSIKNIITKLQERGLKAITITGGGEPTTYPAFNKLAEWLKEKNLLTALLTNGTNDKCGKETINTWDTFSWIRVSLNFLNGKLRNIKVPKTLNKGNVGMSMVYYNQTFDMLKEVEEQAEIYNARFVRLIPDATLPDDKANIARDKLNEFVDKLGNNRFYVQKKIIPPATLEECHQSRLRPFILADGSVAPCDCFMLNRDENGKIYKTLPKSFNLSPRENDPTGYLDYLDHKYTPKFNPIKTCKSCSFASSNQILEDLIKLHEKFPNESVPELFARMGKFPSENIADVDFI